MTKEKNERPTLGLAMIMKDEIADLDRIITDYGKYFDKIYVTVTHKQTHIKLLKESKIANNLRVELSYFKWIDHFGKARLYNQSQIKTDYWMWLDLDDEIEGIDNVSEMLEYMGANSLDVVWLQYETIRRVSLVEHGSMTWRERIIRAASNLEWKNEAIHEYIDTHDDTQEAFLSYPRIKHRKTALQSKTSSERNILILEKEWNRSHRAITAWYIGKYLTRTGNYQGAIEKFTHVVNHSKIKPERFRAWQAIGDCYFQIGNYGKSLDAANSAAALYSNHPGPWYQRFAAYASMGDFDEALKSGELAMGMHVEGELTHYSHDPSKYQYRGPFAVAQAYLSVGNKERAYQIYQKVRKTAPGYIEELSAEMGVPWNDIFEGSRNDDTTAGSARQ